MLVGKWILSPMLLVLKRQKKQWGVLWRQLSRLVIFGEPSVGSVRALSWCGRRRGDCASNDMGEQGRCLGIVWEEDSSLAAGHGYAGCMPGQ